LITVYGRKTSSNVQAVMWAPGELGPAHGRLAWREHVMVSCAPLRVKGA